MSQLKTRILKEKPDTKEVDVVESDESCFPAWVTIGVLPACLAVTMGVGAVNSHVQDAIKDGLNKAKIELSARQNLVRRDIERQSVVGLPGHPAIRKRAFLLIDGKKIGELPASTDHISSDDIAWRFTALQKEVTHVLAESKAPRVVAIQEEGGITTLVARPDMLCGLWGKAKGLFAEVSKTLHVSLFSPTKVDTSAIADTSIRPSGDLFAFSTFKSRQVDYTK